MLIVFHEEGGLPRDGVPALPLGSFCFEMNHSVFHGAKGVFSGDYSSDVVAYLCGDLNGRAVMQNSTHPLPGWVIQDRIQTLGATAGGRLYWKVAWVQSSQSRAPSPRTIMLWFLLLVGRSYVF